MKRRILLTTVAIAIIVAVGLGARRDDIEDPAADLCETDLAAVFKMCEQGQKNCPCEQAPDAFADACQAGCVRAHCPNQVPCTGMDPVWCAPCSDMQGASFWDNLDGAAIRCDYKLNALQTKADASVLMECRKADMEQHCPALANTDWWARFRTAIAK